MSEENLEDYGYKAYHVEEKEDLLIKFICDNLMVMSYQGIDKLKEELSKIDVEITIKSELNFRKFEYIGQPFTFFTAKELINLLKQIDTLANIDQFQKYYSNDTLLKQITELNSLTRQKLSDEQINFRKFLTVLMSIYYEIIQLYGYDSMTDVIESEPETKKKLGQKFIEFISYLLSLNSGYLIRIYLLASHNKKKEEQDDNNYIPYGRKYMQGSGIPLDCFNLKELKKEKDEKLNKIIQMMEFTSKNKGSKPVGIAIKIYNGPWKRRDIDNYQNIFNNSSTSDDRFSNLKLLYKEAYKEIGDLKKIQECSFCPEWFERKQNDGVRCISCKQNINFISEKVDDVKQATIIRGLKENGYKYFNDNLVDKLKKAVPDAKFKELEKWAKSLKQK